MYAVGVYLDSGGVATLKRSGKRGQALFDAVSGSRTAKTLLLRFHRSVGGKAVVDALRDALDSGVS